MSNKQFFKSMVFSVLANHTAEGQILGTVPWRDRKDPSPTREGETLGQTETRLANAMTVAALDLVRRQGRDTSAYKTKYQEALREAVKVYAHDPAWILSLLCVETGLGTENSLFMDKDPAMSRAEHDAYVRKATDFLLDKLVPSAAR